VPVDCPPGLLYPSDVIPPDPSRILFVGVAPPERARHFYTDPHDKLRLGLFRVLAAVGVRLTSIPDFLGQGFFLVHTAKCGIQGTHKPNLRVSEACSQRFLAREIDLLRPSAICGLSANIVHPVLRQLSDDWKLDSPLTLGRLSWAVIVGRRCAVMTTKYPTMQWEEETRTHLGELLRALATA
jgi:uracil-DNA glycosylase